MVKELDLKLTLGMAERQQTESPPQSWGGGHRFKSRSDPKSLRVQLFLVQLAIVLVGHSSDVKQGRKTELPYFNPT